MSEEYLIHLFGILGSLITSVQLIPQVYQVYKTKSAKDISALTFATCFVGCIMWFVYGIIIHSSHLVWTNICVATASALLLVAKVIFKRDRK